MVQIDVSSQCRVTVFEQYTKKKPPGDAAPHSEACPICLDAKTNSIGVMALIPCGHLVCKRCMDANPLELCPICRTAVRSTQRVFL